jgi:tRNA threonylcarbamoyladenosine biosynthesis protein TsaE
MREFKITVKAVEETLKFAKELGERLTAGDVITLEGDLGAGKTTFTKGLAKGLGIKRTVNSPTFTIIKEYHGNMPLYHMDVYRLKDSMEDLGFDEYFNGEGVTVVEWAHLIEDQLPSDLLTIQLKLIDDEQRELVFKPIGERYVHLCEEFFNEYFSN